jgi:membrane protein
MSRIIQLASEKAKWLRESLWLDEMALGKHWIVACMRVIAIFWRGIFQNSLLSRAAALSYSSLLALAPVLGIVVLLSVSFLKVNPEAHIKQTLLFIAPSMNQYVGDAPTSAPSGDEAAVADRKEMRDAFDLLLSRMVEGVHKNLASVNQSGRGLAGAAGGLVLVWMGITLLVAVENALNDIWGVKKGRPWGRKIVLYWAVLSLGALSFVALSGLSRATILGKLLHGIPLSERMPGGAVLSGTLLSLAGLTLLLTLFYKFFPNTRVRFTAALAGGLAAAVMLMANKAFSIMYIRSVISIQSLYGSVGIVLVLMFGLYLFWAFLLLGGQLTYAVQNARFIADQKAWENASEEARETTTFAAFVLISRRFSACLPPLSADEIAEKLRVPGNIVNESLARLGDMGLVTALEDGRGSDTERTCFLPARPLKTVTLASFRRGYSMRGADRGAALLRKLDPLVDSYRERMETLLEGLPGEDMEALLALHPEAPAQPAPCAEPPPAGGNPA